MLPVVVLGGGIAGLAAAHHLARQAVKVVLVEPGHVGGWIHTKQTPHVLELGPRSLRPHGHNASVVLDLVHSLGLQTQVLAVDKSDPAARNRYILINNSLFKMPTSPWKLLTQTSGPLKGLLSAILKEPFQPKATGPESIDSFITRRFNKNISDNFVSALVHGIYAGDHSQLDVQSTFNSLWRLEQEHGSIILGAFKNAFKTFLQSYSKTPFNEFAYSSKEAQEFAHRIQKSSIYSFKHGLQTLSNALVVDIQGRGVIVVKGKGTHIGTDSNGVYVNIMHNDANSPQTIRASHVISALPSTALSKLIPSSDLTSLLNIPSATVGLVNLVFKGKRLQTPGFGFLVPKGDTCLIGVVFDSCAMPGQERGDFTRFTVMLGGKHFDSTFSGPDIKDNLLKAAIDAVKIHLKIEGDLVDSNVEVCRECIPQYLVGHEKRVTDIEEAVNNLGYLSIVGSSYRGVAINDVIAYAKVEAEKVSNKLKLL